MSHCFIFTVNLAEWIDGGVFIIPVEVAGIFYNFILSITSSKRLIKIMLFDCRQREPTKDLLQMFMEDNVMRDTFPCLFKLVFLSRLIPTSTASVERIFSLMNLICTDSRNHWDKVPSVLLLRICRHDTDLLSALQVSRIVDTLCAVTEDLQT
jgi:hypothetical protein